MTKRKSIVSSFGRLAHAEAADRLEPEVSATTAIPAKRVPAGIVGTTKRTLTDIREERDRLLQEASSGESILSLDAATIDPSPFRDRLPDDGESGEEFELFKHSLDHEGQKVPVTVRRHPTDKHRFQVVYGHRRVRALSELGQTVRALLVDYNDNDLVVAQGLENSGRKDLSWIEKALFVAEMDQQGIKARDIRAALMVDDAQLAKFRAVTRAVPIKIVELIGRAPRIGRPRWLELAAKLRAYDHVAGLEKTLSADKVRQLSSDDRFVIALSSLADAARAEKGIPKARTTAIGSIGKLTVGQREIRMSVKKVHGDDFVRFMESEIETLLARYVETLKGK